MGKNEIYNSLFYMVKIMLYEMHEDIKVFVIKNLDKRVDY